MFKPTLYSEWLKWDFGEFDRTVSISIDHINKNDKSSFKVLIQIEPPTVSGVIDEILENAKSFDLILGWHPKLINLPNAILFPYGTCWTRNANTIIKNNEISFLTSNKEFCNGHKLRHKIYNWLPNKIGDVNIKKHISPPRIERKEDMLESFKYSIIVENEYIENWFTEKLIDCFICKTIPIYNGCPNISNFFDEKGILAFNNLEQLESILERISNNNIYDKKLKEVEFNFNKSHEYLTIWDRVEAEIRKKL